MELKDLSMCLFCRNRDIRVHQLKNIKTLNGPVLRNEIFFCCCGECEERYMVECDYVDNVMVYHVTDLVRGHEKKIKSNLIL